MEDVFRKEYKPLNNPTLSLFILKVKDKAEELYNLLNESGNPDNIREISLAKTNLETAIMWAVKGLTK